MKKLGMLASFALLLVLTGCSNEAPVEGKLTMKGSPVSEAMVLFQTDDGTVVASGTTDGLGVFKLKTSQGKDKIPAGNYKVCVSKKKAAEGASSTDPKDMIGAMKGFKAAKNELPEKYNSPKTTTLTATVPSKTPFEFNIE